MATVAQVRSRRRSTPVTRGALDQRVRKLIHEGIDAGTVGDTHAQFVRESLGLLIERILNGRLLERTGLSSDDAVSELENVLFRAINHGRPIRG